MNELNLDLLIAKDPLTPHILDIVSQPESTHLILAGGFGIRIKSAFIREQGLQNRTLIPAIPVIRSTQDLDFFLNLDLWIEPNGSSKFRGMLERLGYSVIPSAKNYQFGKDQDPITKRWSVKIDLLSRIPNENEQVKSDSRRVGTGHIHGRSTPEAFAINEAPLTISCCGNGTINNNNHTVVRIPHPYSFINMKLMAAYDWYCSIKKGDGIKNNSEKHVYDVYVLVAMLVSEEVEVCRELSGKFKDLPIAVSIKEHAISLFGDPNDAGYRKVIELLKGTPSDYDTFWQGLQTVLGLME